MTDYSSLAHFGNYDPSSFGWSRSPDLVPFTFPDPITGTLVNFGQCARDALPVFTCVLTELVPHIPGGIGFGPPDDWSYSATDDLDDGSWSFHHYGDAFDLNWRENPMGNYANNPDASQRGAIPEAIADEIARKYGCEHGGEWSGGPGHVGFKDYMHFECHLSPADARRVVLITPPTQEFTVTKDDEATIRQIVREEFNLFTRDDDDDPKKPSPGHQIRTIIQEELADQVPAIAKAVAAAISAPVKTAKGRS